tara:strand:- start:1862 stop:2560 length:699 start_codon:yes stop_codon:yes gene_type:complete
MKDDEKTTTKTTMYDSYIKTCKKSSDKSSSSNMILWESLQETDPKYTKKVDIGRGFTAVDAHYQIQRMTEMFGPIGKGWKWTAEHEIDNGLYFASITVHWKDDEGWYSYGPVTSVSSLTRANGKIDDEAAKKCTTDALTKALSHLGVSADVFLGKFDDSKYVEKLKKVYAVDKRGVKEMISQLESIDSIKKIDAWCNEVAKPWSSGVSEDDRTQLREALVEHKSKIQEKNSG